MLLSENVSPVKANQCIYKDMYTRYKCVRRVPDITLYFLYSCFAAVSALASGGSWGMSVMFIC